MKLWIPFHVSQEIWRRCVERRGTEERRPNRERHKRPWKSLRSQTYDEFQPNDGILQIFHLHPLVGSWTTRQNDTVCIYHITRVHEQCRKHRTEFQVSCWVFCSRALNTPCIKGQKEVWGHLSLSNTTVFFPWGFKICTLGMEDVDKGTQWLFISLETNQQHLSGTYIHTYAEKSPYCWKKYILL